MEFNESVAQRVYAHIAGMPEDEGVEFAKFFVQDLYETDLRNNARTIATHNAKATEVVAKELLDRLHEGDNPEELLGVAAAFAIAKSFEPVIKAYSDKTPWEPGIAWAAARSRKARRLACGATARTWAST